MTSITSTPTHPDHACNALELWYKNLNAKKVGRRCYRGDYEARWRGSAFLEENSDVSDGSQSLNWHILMSPGKTLPPEKPRGWLHAGVGTGEPVVAGVMRQIWTSVTRVAPITVTSQRLS